MFFTLVLSFLFLSSLCIAATDPCEQPGLLFPDPSNCAAFLQCAQGYREPFVLTCSAGTLFHQDHLICDHARNVDCGNRPIPGQTVATTTTSATATTTTHVTETTKTSEVTTTVEHLPATTTTASAAPSTSTQHVISSMKTTAPSFSTMHTTTGTTVGSVGQPTRPLPARVLGLYLAVAADAEPGYHTDDDWTPLLHPYQQEGANVLFLAFINPANMIVPKSFSNLAKSRGTGASGSVPDDTLVLFAIGGYAYSVSVNPWPWLTSRDAAESMAAEVAEWPKLYGCDGVDLDLEEGAGNTWEAGINMAHFVKKLKELNPDIVVTQPTYGYPVVPAVNQVINTAFPELDSIGIMVYEGVESLNYADNYASGSQQNNGISVDVPVGNIKVGCKGTADQWTVMTLAEEVKIQGLRGVIVWYASVIGGFKYDPSWDTSDSVETQEALVEAMRELLKPL